LRCACSLSSRGDPLNPSVFQPILFERKWFSRYTEVHFNRFPGREGWYEVAALVQIESATGPVLFEGAFSDEALENLALDDRVDDTIRSTSASVASVASTIRRCASELSIALNDLPTGQEGGGSFKSAEIEIGIAVTGEGNVIVAKGSADANLKLTLSWNFGTPGL